MQAMESQFDVCTEDLFNQTIKLEAMKKLLTILINNLKSQSSIFQPQNPNMMTSQGNLPLWSQMQLVLLKELMRLRRKLLTLRRN